MATIGRLHERGKNRLLELLPAADRERLMGTMQCVTVKQGDRLFERHKPIEHVDFPLEGLISLVVTMKEGDVAEVGTVGNEGMAGIPLILGAETSASDAFYQAHGRSMRVSAPAFAEELVRHGPLEDILRRYAQGYLNQAAQSAACNRLHPVEQRFCRWILLSHDRIGYDTLPLTQEFLAQMLGVRRASVSVVAGMLQKAGFIRYNRGVIEVLDRARLEESSCECYDVVRKEYERLLC
jgi:CRP-like cAMP-binding protein